MADKLTVSWFSAGVSSAVATKLMADKLDHIIYIHIEDQHPDTLRFVRDCEKWFGKPVEILQSPYKSVDGALCGAGMGYVNGPRGAPCTRLLKRRVRQEWEFEHKSPHGFCYVWGMDIGEQHRASRLRESMHKDSHVFPLIERSLSKGDAHAILRKAGVARPAMYDLGYLNNNCVGCVKGGMAYWNHIRKDFPHVFAARAAMERQIGGSCINGIFLDELDPARGRDSAPIVQACGVMCRVTMPAVGQ